jgi:Mg-chelatase subunit ChlD
MTNDLPPMNREDLEAKVTALLLGELPESEAALMRELIARDAGLARLQARLKLTLDLLRETNAADAAVPAPSAPLKLSQERRQKLLASFKTIAPKEFAPPKRRPVAWPIAIAAVAALALAVLNLPSLSKARTMSQKSAIINNLRLLDSAKQQWALEQRKSPTDVPTMEDLRPYAYRGEGGEMPGGEGQTYVLGAVGQAPTARLKDSRGRESIVTLPDAEGNLASRNQPAPAAASSAPIAVAAPTTFGGASYAGARGGRSAARLYPSTGQPSPSPNLVLLPASAPSNAGELATFDSASVNGAIGLQGGTAPKDQFKQLEGLQSVQLDRLQSPLKSAEEPLAAGTIVLPIQATAHAEETLGRSTFSQDLGKPRDVEKSVRRLDALAKDKQTKDDQAQETKQDVYALNAVGYVNVQPLAGSVVTNSLKENEESTKTTKYFVDRDSQKLTIITDASAIPSAGKAISNLDGSLRTFGGGGGAGGGVLDARKTPGAVAGNLPLDDKADAPLRQPALPPPVPQPEVQTRSNILSTFSLHVSDAAFKLAQASLQNGVMPAAAGIRSEEFINAFDYRDPEAAPGAPIGFAWERAGYPFAHNRDLLRFSVKTAAQGRQNGRPLNLVLLLDKSGSMERADRVEIIHQALQVLASQLEPQDMLSVVVFARTARLWVDGVPGNQAGDVAKGLNGLTPEGGTNLEEAMKLAYATALRHYLANGENRVVLLTDGAANLGSVDPEALKKSVAANRKQGIALDCFGVGFDGYNDNMMETLSRTGNGRYGFINAPEEAATEFAGKLAGALRVAASDVKVQVEFNPNRVTSYRQIGYAKHQLTKEQFRDNSVAAAQIGAAESGNALYTVEVNPVGDGPLCTVRVRFRVPGTTDYQEHAWDVPYTGTAVTLDQASPAMRLAATSAAFAEWLASSPYAGEVTPDQLLAYLRGVPEVYGADSRPKQLEWMIRQAKSMTGK